MNTTLVSILNLCLVPFRSYNLFYLMGGIMIFTGISSLVWGLVKNKK